MNRLRRRMIAALAAAPCLAPLGAAAQQPRRAFEELNPPQPVEAAGKIEVLEFFWYGCIHCYNLEPKLETWLKKVPSDVEFRRVPAVFNQRWAHDATLFYAFEAMGVLDKLHRPFFDAIHRERLRTDNWQELSAWLGKHGIDAKKFEATAKSFGVQAKMKRAIRLTTDYKIDGTPAMAVHGRYTVPSSEAMLDTVNELVAAVRKSK
ncbi:MAG: DSBA-like thioredoxin domain protein [Burkholderiales bacterium]|nr:DSBA-like thioredoxin domain protein [Burkholderiales bacterium]